MHVHTHVHSLFLSDSRIPLCSPLLSIVSVFCLIPGRPLLRDTILKEQQKMREIERERERESESEMGEGCIRQVNKEIESAIDT